MDHSMQSMQYDASRSWGLRLWTRFYTLTILTSKFSTFTFSIFDFSNFDFHFLLQWSSDTTDGSFNSINTILRKQELGSSYYMPYQIQHNYYRVSYMNSVWSRRNEQRTILTLVRERESKHKNILTNVLNLLRKTRRGFLRKEIRRSERKELKHLLKYLKSVFRILPDLLEDN